MKAERLSLPLFAALALCASTAMAAEFDFLKPYEGRWHGSAQTSFGPAALNLRLNLKNPDKPVLEAVIKPNSGQIVSNASISGKNRNYLLELPYTKGEGPLHKLHIPLVVSRRGVGNEISVRVRESSETFNGAFWISDAKQGDAYKLEVTLPAGLRVAGVPLPLPQKVDGALKTDKFSASAAMPVFPAISLELKASRNAAPDKLEISGSFALYYF
ncbi:MAG TPA: hypothetical protein PLL10_05230, partial [Elusimicrobiales bacterium]|nr:hypothetical protein [Elusimicrobiales bacterium]